MTLPEISIGPAPVLALIVGAFHACLYVLIRGSAGARLPFVLVAAVLGALAGNAIAARVGDPLRLGDFGLLWASAIAWLGIVLIAVASTLGPSRQRGWRRQVFGTTSGRPRRAAQVEDAAPAEG